MGDVVDGFVWVFVVEDGLRSRMWLRWLTIREVMVSGLR